MIFVSTANVKKNNIKDAISELAAAGFKNIELSGGTKFYSGYKDDLRELRSKHGLAYRVHNYFPPPETPFVLNLAATDESVLEKSLQLIRNAIDLSVEFGSQWYGFHAGFRMTPSAGELGKSIQARSLTSHEGALSRFVEYYRKAEEYARSKGVQLFIENNVVSARNFQNFDKKNPFLLTCSEEYLELQKLCPFRLLLDVAHLKVSCRTLELDFASQLQYLVRESEYLHLSDNDGLSDSNKEILETGELYQLLSGINLGSKTLTLEIGDTMDCLTSNYLRMEKLCQK